MITRRPTPTLLQIIVFYLWTGRYMLFAKSSSPTDEYACGWTLKRNIDVHMEEPPSCETRYLFLAGHVLLIIGFTCYVVGFATVGWVDAGGVRQGWLEGSRILLTFGPYLLPSGVPPGTAVPLLVLHALLVCHRRPRHVDLGNIGRRWIFIGVCIMGRNGEREGSLQFLFSNSCQPHPDRPWHVHDGLHAQRSDKEHQEPQLHRAADTCSISLSDSSTRPLTSPSRSLVGYRGTCRRGQLWATRITCGATRKASSQLPYIASHYHPLSARQLHPLEHFPDSQDPLPFPSAPPTEDRPPSYAEAINTGYM
ncbi:hypothetical protein C0Q70_01755 [Pomacea canaliculata]|uniref:Uncharacterized protein n=1 Tax=Pomacea canaliculata TaxID=400727 RepID=A0A2T7Q0G0_POMCA|nr:hypothetical protein C0Q70_01755 [Pomacea canaliculata]